MIHLTVGFKAIIVIAIIAVASVSGVLLYEANAKANSHPPLKPAQFYLTNLTVNPLETNINQPVSIKVNVENIGQEVGNYSADLWVNGTLSQNKEVTLDRGQTLAVDFTLSEPNPGVYSIWIENLTTTFSVIAPPSATPAPTSPPTPKPTDRVTGGGGTVVGGGGNTGSNSGGTRTWTSCPSLFVWNGTGYSRVSEISDGPGWLGFVDHYNKDGSITFAYSNPWSFIKLNSSALHPVNNFYDMTVTEQSDEIFYLDSIKLLAADHSADVDVYSTRGTYLYNLTEQGTIYTIGHNLLVPTLALNNGVDVLQQVSTLDGNYTTANRWSWNTLELNLGDLSAANSIKLVVNAVTNWPTNEQGGNWATQFSNQPGITPSPPPYMEVKAANGTWVKVADSRQFPIPPVDPSTFVVDLTGLFPTNNYSLRINYYQDYTFDYIGVDKTSHQTVSLHEISPTSSILSQAFATNSNSTGSFTRYGDVSALVASADDMYVVGRQGDSIQLKFQDAVPIPNGVVRDYFVVASAWFKGQGLPYVPFTVEPLPFQNMTSYPYPATESYPSDSTHQAFLFEYNTRQFTVQSLALQSVDNYQNQDSAGLLLISAVLLIIVVAIFAYRRKR